ncbi:MAG: hypothetical protein K1X82_05125 [Bacteroidia bacterium]|jgi:hypothetical protein|nr:hypothetical protein [Bacteroidia bacterium]
MISINPQFIKDSAGNTLVILPEKEFDSLLTEIEDLEDIRAYDDAKKEDNGERILLSEYLNKRKEKNG